MRISEFVLNFKYAFKPRKPLLFFRLGWAFVIAALFKRKVLRYVDFAVDFRCNLRCEHCFATSLENEKRTRMCPADYKRVAHEAMSLGAVNFSFQGGEPLLFASLGEVIASCRPWMNVISVTTNGTLLTEENLAKLKKWGVDILTISLDSSIAREHDHFRGMQGAYDRTIAGINNALAAGFRVTLGTVVTHGSLRSEGINGLIKLARKLKVLLYLILPVPAGRWQNNSDMFLTEEDLAYIEKLTFDTPYIRTDFQANLGGYGCGAAKEILYITPYGDVLTCPFLHISLGNIFEGPLKDMREKAFANEYFKDYHKKCLASTDAEFIEKYLSRTFKADVLPVPWESVFGKEKNKN